MVSRALPGSVSHALTSALAPVFVALRSDHLDVVRSHQRRAHDGELSDRELERAIRAAFASYARYWVESFRLPTTPAYELDARLSLEGLDHLDRGLAAGRGVILALPHLGGWEWAGTWLCANGYDVTVVVEALEPREVFDWFVDLRSALGMTVVPLDRDAGGRVMAALRANHVVCLLSDRDLGRGGIEVDFLGERTTLPAGPATLALRTGAALVPGATLFEGPGHRGIVRPPLDTVRRGHLREDVARVTQALAYELEVLIRMAPEQWHLFQPNWPSDPGYVP